VVVGKIRIDMENLLEIEKGKEKNRDQKPEELLHRITVSKRAEQALVSIVERVNDGFDGGKVNRTQIANWVLARFSEDLGDTEIREIRAEHFDEISLLESILKKAKETGKVPTEFKGLLQRQLGFDDQNKKPNRKALTKLPIIDDTINDGKE
jgi:hypothetical protein